MLELKFMVPPGSVVDVADVKKAIHSIGEFCDAIRVSLDKDSDGKPVFVLQADLRKKSSSDYLSSLEEAEARINL